MNYKSSFFRGGGCGASKPNMPKYQQNQITIPMATMDQIKIKIQKIKDCTNPEYLLGHIQFFLINERYLQFLTENVQECQAHYPYILDRIYDLLNAIIFNIKLRTKLSQQCAYHLLEITAKLMKMIFVFCANDNQLKPIRMPTDKYNTYLSLITQMKTLISSEETDKFYKNSLWYEYQIIYIIWMMIPNDSQPKIEDVILNIVSHSITAFSTGIINPALFAAIFDGIKLLYKAINDNTANIKFQIIYSLELIRWRLIEQIERNDPFNISKQTILDVYQYVKETDDWMIMFCWIKNLGAIFNHLPTIKQDLMSDQDLMKFVKKQYLFRIAPNIYQINLNFEKLQSDPDAFHLISHVESFQNLAQMQSLILQGNDILPSFENYYLTSDTKPDDTRDTLTSQERSYRDLRLGQMQEFIEEIQNDITDFQNEVELAILQGNSKMKKNCDFSKIQLIFNQLFNKLFSLNLFQGQLELIERLWRCTKPEYFQQMQQNKSECNSIEIKAFKTVAEQELKIIKFAKMMHDTKGQSQNMDAEFIEIFKQQKRQNPNQLDLQQFQFFAEEWIILQNDPSQDKILALLKKIKNQKVSKLNSKKVKTLEQHVQMFQTIFYQYNCVNQLHKCNLKTVLILKCLIQQQFYQKEYYQINSKHNKEVQLQILCLSKQLLGYDYFAGILVELTELSNNLEHFPKELQKLNTDLYIDHQLPVLILRQIISKDQNLTHSKIVKLLQYFVQQQNSIEQIIADQSVEDLNSYFDILSAIQQNIFDGINEHKKIYKQSKEYLNILQNARHKSIDDQISEGNLNLQKVFNNLKQQYKNVQIDKIMSSRKIFQICQNSIQMYLEQNQSLIDDSIKAQIQNLLKIQELNQIILDVSLEESTQNTWLVRIFEQINQLIKCEPENKKEQQEKISEFKESYPLESPPVSPGQSPRHIRQLKSIKQPTNQQDNPLLELYHQKFMDLEILALQIQDNLVLMKKKNSNQLKIMQALKNDNDFSQAIKQERSFSVEMKCLRKISFFQIEEIDDSLYDDYQDYIISASYEQNLKFMSQQIQNTVLNIFADRPKSKFQIYKQKALDFIQNSPWRFRHQAAFLLQQMKDKCLHESINDTCLKVLTRFYAYESDQRVRYVLENQQNIIQILGQHWPSQEEQIQEQMKESLKDLNNLGFELQQVIDQDQRKIIQFKIQEKQKDIEEIIKNITNIGNALGIQILFIQDLKQDLIRIEGKINEISDSLNQMSADIRYLRGKTVAQLLEIRMNRILQNKLIFDSRSVYVQLKTKEKLIKKSKEYKESNESKESKESKEEMITNLYTNDIFGDGEINEFLWKEPKDSMLIHGQAGSGKSTAARKIEEFLWTFYKQNQSITEQIPLIPIMINLPSLKNPKHQAIEEVLKSDSYRFDNKQILEFKEAIELGKYRLVIILDSYDEMNQSLIGINLNFTNKLQKWRQYADLDKYPKIITTTRTEIFNTNDYYTWFLSESNNAQDNFKEVRLLKFTNSQVQDYLKQFTKLNVKKTLFEYYQQLIPNSNEIDQLERFEQLWAQIQILDGKQQLLSERDVSQIIQLLKQDKNIQMFTNEIERSLNSELKQLWATQIYLTCIQTMHLYDLLETPFMMEIVVQVLPIIVKKKSEPDQVEPTFIKHFTELKLLELDQTDAKKLAEQIWETLKENSNFFNHFQITMSSSVLLSELNKEFPRFQESSDSAIIVQALLSQDLVQYDYYDFFFEMYFERQIRKLQDNGQAYDYFSLQREIRQFATELAIQMTNEEKTQIEYKSNGLLYKQVIQDNWTDHYFDDSDGKEGQFRKLYRSCIPMKQRNSFYSFNHKSLQEFLIARDFYLLISRCPVEGIDYEGIEQNAEEIEKHNINKTYWVSEFMIGACHFIVDKLKRDRIGKDKMIKIVQGTAKNKKIVIAGSNCLLLLSKMGEFLGGQDFRGIVIQNIDLTGTNFHNSNLALSEFDNVNISNINFNYCNLESVKWKNIRINQLPNLDESKYAIKQIAFISDKNSKILISVDESFKIKKFDINLGKEQVFSIQNKYAKQIRCCNINSSYIVLVETQDSQPDGLEVLDLQTQKWIIKSNIDFITTKIEFISQTEVLFQNTQSFQKLNLNTKKFENMDYLKLDGSLQGICTNIKGHLVALLQKQQNVSLKVTIFDQNKNTQSIYTNQNQQTGIIAFSPNGTILAVGAEKQISLWYWYAQQSIGSIQLEHPVDQFIFSHDETRLISLSNKKSQIQIWNLNTKQQIGPIYNHDNDPVLTVGLSEDNMLIASGLQSGTIKCWDTQSSELQQLQIHQETLIHQVLFSRDAQLLLISTKKSIEVWHLFSKMSLIKELKGFKSKLTCMTMSQNQNIVCAGNKEAKIYVWNLSDGELKHAIPTHQSYPLDLKMIDDNQIVSIEINSIIKFINLQERKIKFINTPEPFDLYDNIQSYKNAFKASQSKDIYTRCSEKMNYYIIQNRHLIELEDDKCEIQFNYFLSEKPEQKVLKIPKLDINKSLYKFGKTNKIFGMVNGDYLEIYRYFNSKQLNEHNKKNQDKFKSIFLKPQQSKFNFLQFDSHDQIIFLANNENIQVFSISQSDDKLNLSNLGPQLDKQNTEPIIALTYSLNMEYIYGGCQNGLIQRWNYRSKKFIDSFQAPDQLQQLMYSTPLLCMISISKNSVLLWNNLHQSKPLLKNDEQFQQFYYSELSQDKLILALAADKFILLIDIEHNEILDRILVPTPCEYFCYSSRKLCILAKFGNKLFKFQLSVQKNIQEFIIGQKKQPECLSVHKDNIAIGISNGSILFGTQQCMNEQFQHSTEKIISVHLTSEYLLSGSATQIRIWKLDKVNSKEITEISLETIAVKNLSFCKLLSKDQIMVIENNNPIVYLKQNEQYSKIVLDENSIQNTVKQKIAMDTDGNRVIVFYKYLLLKKYIKKDLTYSCSHTYGQNQSIEGEDVKLNQAKIVSYLGLDLSKLFNRKQK